MAISLPPKVNDLERRLGVPADSLQDEDKERAEAALEDATVLALAEVSTRRADEWESNAPKVVALVILKAARREYENPQGFTSEAQGDHSASLTETSGVFLTDREKGLIRAAATGRSGLFVGSVRITSAYGDRRRCD